MPEGLLSQSGLHVDHLIKIKKFKKQKVLNIFVEIN